MSLLSWFTNKHQGEKTQALIQNNQLGNEVEAQTLPDSQALLPKKSENYGSLDEPATGSDLSTSGSDDEGHQPRPSSSNQPSLTPKSLRDQGRSLSEPKTLPSNERDQVNVPLKRRASDPTARTILDGKTDVTELMKKAYNHDWQYFKNLAKGNVSFTEKIKGLFNNLSATDRDGQTVLHWAIRSSKITDPLTGQTKEVTKPETALTTYWLLTYLKENMEPNDFSKLLKKKNNNSESIKDILFNRYKNNPFDPNDPLSDGLPYLYYGLFLNHVNDRRLYNDVLGWAVARNKKPEVERIINLAFHDPKFIYRRDGKMINDKTPTDYAKTAEMRKSIESLPEEFRRKRIEKTKQLLEEVRINLAKLAKGH
jgi:hypothetical protein